MMRGYTEQLQKIMDDILKVLKEAQRPMTQRELFEQSDLNKTTAFIGWSFALDKLRKNGSVRMNGHNEWHLV